MLSGLFQAIPFGKTKSVVCGLAQPPKIAANLVLSCILPQLQLLIFFNSPYLLDVDAPAVVAYLCEFLQPYFSAQFDAALPFAPILVPVSSLVATFGHLDRSVHKILSLRTLRQFHIGFILAIIYFGLLINKSIMKIVPRNNLA